MTFPAIRSLKLGLIAAEPLLASDAAIFSGLHACQHLSQLRLEGCAVSKEAVETCAAAVGGLLGLREVTLASFTQLGLITHLTGVTQLALLGHSHQHDEWVTVAARNSQLRCFSMFSPYSWGVADMRASGPEQLLRGCPSITELDLRSSNIGQAGLDVLLTHGTKHHQPESSPD
jgi:hypothetical protein